MKKIQYVLLFVSLICCSGLLAQQKAGKPILNNDAQNEWRRYCISGSPKISNDGRYIAFEYSTPPGGARLAVETADGKLVREFAKANSPVFTPDSKRLVFSKEGGKTVFDLSKRSSESFSNPCFVSSCGKWLILQNFDKITLINLLTAKKKEFPLISSDPYQYTFNQDGSILVVNGGNYLVWVDLVTSGYKVIQHGSPVNNVNFDGGGRAIAFFTKNGERSDLCYYRAAMDSASVLVSPASPGMREGFKVSDAELKFGRDGDQVFFRISRGKKAGVLKKDSTMISPGVNVWHYKSEYLYSEEKASASDDHLCLAVVGISNKKVIPLEAGDSSAVAGELIGKYVVVRKKYNKNDSWWNKDVLPAYDILSTVDGRRRTFLSKLTIAVSPSDVSPSDKFVIWYDPALQGYFSYEIAGGITRKIAGDVDGSWAPGIDYQFADAIVNTYGITGWLRNDEAVIVYSRYDIWQLDPYGRKAPLNLTAGYGAKNKVQFRLDDRSWGNRIFKPNERVLLAAFDEKNKDNGYAEINIGRSGPPRIWVMEPVLMSYADVNAAPPPGIKAKDANVYLLSKQTAAVYPNFYVTRDFKDFRAVTDIHPEDNYNWMTSELVNFITLDGEACQGILYKPANFDAQKIYPLLFNYYDRRSNGLHQFLKPELSGENINIPWYVSNGYLVFTPDINYKPGHTAKSVINSVVAAARCLKQFSWVGKMGLQGHSFGGYETNVLITGTNLFSCAQEGAGVSDAVSGYGGRRGNTVSSVFSYESGQYNLRTTPWERPDIYMENSPIFHVSEINTPLLMLHGEDDHAVSFSQAVELFTALRRLKKPVWLLDYGHDHILGRTESLLDFTIRQQQFFDHYLKGSPPPAWMTRGIPAKDKGIKSGLELDPGGKCSDTCPVCNPGLSINKTATESK